MKFLSTLGIVVLAVAIILGEWRGSKSKKMRAAMAGITLAATLLALLLLIYPGLPGPTRMMKLLFGRLDKIME
ncbi:hypothetical protein PA598K_02666 [Paenibacillus sp. 598K]|uniref:hypothetical protein n=1 Tax=Paenibacillus sp. 598K TaxID=1117987 RepID=UPI000FFA003F|nr:hypothetical protein [Paenibacillus sp. 598K]GBF74328.1 hypothetical protein PA598K_02666 [Paenibacillus sp. 598K]